MNSLMLGLQTNRRWQHYSEQQRDPPNSSLSLKQKSEHSSRAPVVLNLCSPLSVHRMVRAVNTHTHTCPHKCGPVSREVLAALAPSFVYIFLFFLPYFYRLFWTSLSLFVLFSDLRTLNVSLEPKMLNFTSSALFLFLFVFWCFDFLPNVLKFFFFWRCRFFIFTVNKSDVQTSKTGFNNEQDW